MTTREPLARHTYADGSGAPLVLLPSFPLNRRMWDDVAALLPRGRTVLAVDPPGFGASPPPERMADALGADPQPSLETVADAVAATLRATGVDRAVVAGLSMGGYVAMALLERHPGLVAGLGLLSTRSTPDDDAARANRHRVADAVVAAGTLDELAGTPRALLGADSRVGRPDLLERMARWIGDANPHGVAWAQRAMAARPDRTAVLTGFAGPAVVVVGDQDEVTPVPAARHMAGALIDAELVVVPGVGHMTSLEDPASVASALGRLLARVADADRA
ncbi:alpha/beta fold hydrolase [uncultured Cellulomonas sp.]|uniref:alpha/beta fold hydrolase n=1 Tax=uncultured Cellulomonas sp. TaxID=189682 RepID=UPI0026209D21|nr:alpha/beta hydrolase [uncultured Cellulomonas sp.]